MRMESSGKTEGSHISTLLALSFPIFEVETLKK